MWLGLGLGLEGGVVARLQCTPELAPKLQTPLDQLREASTHGRGAAKGDVGVGGGERRLEEARHLVRVMVRVRVRVRVRIAG